jgi:hypothetical protein
MIHPDPELMRARGGYGWVYRRRLAIIQAVEADAEVRQAEARGAAVSDATSHARVALDIQGARTEAMARYDFPPYPCDRGYRWFRIRDALGLTRRPR